MVIIVDTETSGFAENRLLQLGAILCEGEEVVQEVSLLVRPSGWKVEEGAQKVHGISQEKAEKLGLPVDVVLGVLVGMAREAEVIVGHNLQFDLDRVLWPEIARAGWPRLNRKRFCTMEAMVGVCKIPPTEAMKRAGRTGWKSPKLMEAYEFAFGESFEGAHGAIVDARATARLYWWIQERKGVAAPVATLTQPDGQTFELQPLFLPPPPPPAFV